MILDFRRENMTTREIVDILFDGNTELWKSPRGYQCYFSLYRCNLDRDDVSNLFEIGIDKSFSFLNPYIWIYIPDADISEIYKHDEKFNQDKLNYMMKIFSEDITRKYGKELTYIVFSILHEVGHWKYICDNNYSPQEYEENDSIERESFYKDNAGNNTEGSFLKYRKITSEKEADKYAMSELKDALESIISWKKAEYGRV